MAPLKHFHRTRRSWLPLAGCLLGLLLAAPLPAAPVDFVREIQPLLEKHCYACHAEKKQKSGLRLDIKSQAFKGGELYEASILPGDARNSPLVQFVADPNADLKMPPDGPGLSDREISLLSRWVNEGASWPEGVDRATLADPLDHWSFKPPVQPAPPQTDNVLWPRHEIDRFILARLEQAGLRPGPEADRITWLRRVTLDLTGLPPAPEEVHHFLQDSRENACEHVVDRLLASPRYGERWAQHWLDVVRYADTHGFEVNTERPHAWPYRDYVIRAFNSDTPYHQFIREQIVGDALQQDAATGFLVTASVLLPGQIGKDEPSKRLARQDALDEIVVNIGQTFMGLSLGCARCHDHKFDPVTQADYYSLQAFVAGVEYADREWLTPEILALRQKSSQLSRRLAQIDTELLRFEPLARAGTERPMINARQNTDRFAPLTATKLRFTIEATNQLEPCLDELEVFNTDGNNIALASAGTLVTASGSNVSLNRHELRFLNDGEYGNARSWMSNQVGQGWVELQFSASQEIERVNWGRDRQGKFKDRLATAYRIEIAAEDGVWHTVADQTDRVPFGATPTAPAPPNRNAEETRQLADLLREKRELETSLAQTPAPQLLFAGKFREPDTIHVLTRGDPEQPKGQVVPAVPRLFGELQLPSDTPEQHRRRALADWIASPQHPLTARVFVNRIWQGHFGTGLVDTASDFGHGGQPPSHPELLDWLTLEFLRAGWSMKHLHKIITLSATYRQAAAPPLSPTQASPAVDPQLIDADARLLWRYPSRRLDAETIRDSMLFISGELQFEMYGPGYDLFDKRGGLTGFQPVEQFPESGLRRMIYAHKVRRERDAVFGAFDCPDGGQGVDRRRESTTPIQALNLFNSRFTLDRAAAFAKRIRNTNPPPDTRTAIQAAYQLALSRRPTPDELDQATPVVDTHGLATLCRVLFNCNEFLFMP